MSDIGLALTARAEIAAWWRSDDGRRWEETAPYVLRRYLTDKQAGLMRASEIAAKKAEVALAARPWYVSADMVTLLQAAYPTMPSQELLPTDVPTESGIVVFEKSLVVTDHDSEACSIDVMAWSSGASFQDDRERTVITLDFYRDRNRSLLTPLEERLPFRWIPAQETGWAVGETLTPEIGGNAGRVSHWRRITAALWALSQQTISVVTEQAAPRQLRRQLANRIGAPVSPINVVTLRRTRPDGPEPAQGGGVDWSHRWLVSGHWRNQWCPRSDSHRQTWIASYVKGPDDKPLVVKETAYRLIR